MTWVSEKQGVVGCAPERFLSHSSYLQNAFLSHTLTPTMQYKLDLTFAHLLKCCLSLFHRWLLEFCLSCCIVSAPRAEAIVLTSWGT